MAVFTAMGFPDPHYSQLTKMFELGTVETWTTVSKARSGNRVVWYLRAPLKAFVAVGTILSKPELEFWDGDERLMAEMRVDQMLGEPLTLNRLKEELPEFKFGHPKIQLIPPGIEQPFWNLVYKCIGASINPNADDHDEVNTSSVRPGGGFEIDSERRQLIEIKSVEYVKQWFVNNGWTVDSREKDGCGYDLHCTKGSMQQHVEVKGTAGSVPAFNITAGELRRAKNDPLFLLSVVTDTLSGDPTIWDFPGNEATQAFAFQPLSYKATFKPDDT